MRYNYKPIKDKIALLLKFYGTKAVIEHRTGKRSITSLVWGESKRDNQPPSDPVLEAVKSHTCYIAAIRNVPEVGDDVVVGADSYNIIEVRQYQPAKVVIAYKMLVTG